MGLRQQYLLGNYIRNKYITQEKLLDGVLDGKQFEMLTEASGRCVLSAQGHAFGLFPL